MKSIFQKLTRCVRLATVAFALFSANDASADWLYWTVDFTDSLGNEGDLNSNPAGAGATGYDIYLVIQEEGGGNTTYIKGGALISDQMYDETTENYWQVIDLSELGSDALVFYAEMVKTGASGSATEYKSATFSYSEIIAYSKSEIGALETAWNPAVGGAWSTPEPTSGMLVLWGFGLLMLRRKKSDRG